MEPALWLEIRQRCGGNGDVRGRAPRGRRGEGAHRLQDLLSLPWWPLPGGRRLSDVAMDHRLHGQERRQHSELIPGSLLPGAGWTTNHEGNRSMYCWIDCAGSV